jgi:hypothetical protein
MVIANVGEGVIFADIIQDWFQFLGGKPGEVVVVDGGSGAEAQAIYWQLFQDKVIDKLHLIRSYDADTAHNHAFRCEYTAAAIASKPYFLLFQVGTTPYRQGHDDWLEQAIAYLDRDEVFAVGSSHHLPIKHSDAWDGWYYSKTCNSSFTLIKRELFMASQHELDSKFILSGFQGESSDPAIGDDRPFSEVAFERYMANHNRLTLCKAETPDWTVAHVKPMT